MRLSVNSRCSDDAIRIFGIDRSGVFGEVCNTTEIKMDRNFGVVHGFLWLELEVPTITGGVSGCRDRH
jgi:hypothetical protein